MKYYWQSFRISIGIILLLVGSYQWIDRPVARWVKSECVGEVNTLFVAITQLGGSTWYLVGSAVAFGFFRYVKRYPLYAHRFAFVFASVAVSGIATDIIKVIAGRFRPEKWFNEGLYGFDFFHVTASMISFPSGHTATAFSLAMVISKLYPKYALIGWAIALAVGISRVMVSMHYVSDVIAGAMVGVVSVHLLVIYWSPKWFVR